MRVAEKNSLFLYCSEVEHRSNVAHLKMKDSDLAYGMYLGVIGVIKKLGLEKEYELFSENYDTNSEKEKY